MSPNDNLSDLRSAWHEQELPSSAVSLSAIRSRAEKLDRQLRRRNWREWIASALVAPYFLFEAVQASHALTRLGYVVSAGALVYIAYRLYRSGRAHTPSPTLPTREHVQMHREQLATQAALLRRVPLWYLGPLFVGLCLVIGGRVAAGAWPTPLGGLAVAVLTTGFAAVAWLNRAAAKKLEAQADELQFTPTPPSTTTADTAGL